MLRWIVSFLFVAIAVAAASGSSVPSHSKVEVEVSRSSWNGFPAYALGEAVVHALWDSTGKGIFLLEETGAIRRVDVANPATQWLFESAGDVKMFPWKGGLVAQIGRHEIIVLSELLEPRVSFRHALRDPVVVASVASDKLVVFNGGGDDGSQHHVYQVFDLKTGQEISPPMYPDENRPSPNRLLPRGRYVYSMEWRSDGLGLIALTRDELITFTLNEGEVVMDGWYKRGGNKQVDSVQRDRAATVAGRYLLAWGSVDDPFHPGDASLHIYEELDLEVPIFSHMSLKRPLANRHVLVRVSTSEASMHYKLDEILIREGTSDLRVLNIRGREVARYANPGETEPGEFFADPYSRDFVFLKEEPSGIKYQPGPATLVKASR